MVPIGPWFERPIGGYDPRRGNDAERFVGWSATGRCRLCVVSLERELRDTSDSLMRALEQLHDLEAQKRDEPTGSETFVELARRVEELAADVLRRTEREASLAEDTQERRQAGGGVGRTINEVPASSRDLATILSDWREAERRLAATDPRSSESSVAAADVRRLREEYRIAHEARLMQKG